MTKATASLATSRKLRAHLERSMQQAAEAVEKRHQEFGARIAAAREKKKWRQKELAAAVHVEPVTVSRWENGHAMPTTATIRKIAEALEVPMRDLLVDPLPAHPSEVEELRAEVQALHEVVEALVARIDRVLQEPGPPQSGTQT